LLTKLGLAQFTARLLVHIELVTGRLSRSEMQSARRFPPPWFAEVQPNHYVVRDANKQQLAYVPA
jgi:hypothetical protein